MRRLTGLFLAFLMFPTISNATEPSTFLQTPGKMVCPAPPAITDKMFSGIKAVGLLVRTQRFDQLKGNAAATNVLNAENLVNVFSKRIREKILPFVVPDANCQIPDLVTLSEHGPERFYLKDFIGTENTLVVVVDLDIPLQNPPKTAILSLNYFRTSERPVWKDMWRNYGDVHEVISLDLPEGQIFTDGVLNVLQAVHVPSKVDIDALSDDREPNYAFLEREEREKGEAMKKKPAIKMIGLPSLQ